MNAVNFINRRTFLNNTGLSFGSAALLSQLTRAEGLLEKYRGLSGFPHHAPKAKRVIFLCMAGGPSHLETFDYKPQLNKLSGKAMPESFTKGQPIAQLKDKPLRSKAISLSSKNMELQANTSLISFPTTRRWRTISPS
jgi:hypothetical protein